MKRIISLFCLLGTFTMLQSQTGDLIWEIFSGFGGTFAQLSATTIAPTKTTVITTLEGPQTSPDINGYKSRIKGYIIPTITGDYTFYIASDDESDFWLSTDAQASNITRVCYAPGYRGNYTSGPEQKSALISLTAGKPYYFEVLHAEGSGGDFVKVGWTKPGESAATINTIGSAYISQTAASNLTFYNPELKAGRIPINSTNNVFYDFSMKAEQGPARLTSIKFKMTGTYDTNEIKKIKLWINTTDASFAGATQIGTTISSATTGSVISFSNLSKSLPLDTTWFFLSCDVLATATAGHTIGADTTSFYDMTFGNPVNFITTGPVAKGGFRTIQEIKPASVKISRDTATYPAGTVFNLSAQVLTDSTSYKNVLWFSSNPAIATVNAYGKVTTLIDGTVSIIATSYDTVQKDSCVVTLTPNNTAVKSFFVDPGILNIEVGQATSLSVVTDPVFVSRATLTWKTSDAAVAAVDAQGTLTAVTPGKAIITATLQGAKDAMCVVWVLHPSSLNPENTGISVYPVPAKDRLFVSSTGSELKNIQISDMNGICRISSIITGNESSIDIASLPSGIYVIRVASGNSVLQKLIRKE